MLDRRRFLASTGVTVAFAALVDSLEAQAQATPSTTPIDWERVRGEFNLSPDYIHLALFFLTAHPRPVREAIERLRRELDANPVLTVEHNMFEPEFGHITRLIKTSIANYIGGRWEEVALTGSTTESLASVYQGLPLKAGDEILTTTHDHYSHHESIRLSTERAGASWRKISLFDSFGTISEDSIVERIRAAIRPNTRAVGVTWVHSSSGVKLPLRRIAEGLAPINASRDPKDRVLLIVDGVHGIGVEDPAIASTGVDFFCAGTHKWVFGPRGTAFIWAPADRWARLRPTVPSFDAFELFESWALEKAPVNARASWFTPGGFHAFEHYWAVPAAIEFHQKIGPSRVTERIHALNSQVKEEMAKMPHVELYTPRADALSAGIVCFDVKSMTPPQVVTKLLEKKIIATTSPYRISYARVAFGLPNTTAEVETTLRALRSLAAS